MRWSDYIMAHDGGDEKVESLWEAASGDAIFVLAEGFDPRTLEGVRRFLRTRRKGVTILSLGMPPSGEANLKTMARANAAGLEQLAKDHAAKLLRVAYPVVAESRVAGQRIAQLAIKDGRFDGCGLIVIDVSAMPAAIHFAILSGVLQYCSAKSATPDIQVVVCENPSLDAVIRSIGTSPADTLGGFTHGLDLENLSNQVRIWAPVLGLGDASALRTLFERLDTQEICPVVPFPARDPRRGDDVLLEHRVLLFEEMGVDPRNIIYADERNPFDLYRALSRLNQRYREAIEEPLGEMKIVLSSHASKLMSLGVTLAAHENKLPVVGAPPTDYSLDASCDIPGLQASNRLVCLWLEGQPYQEHGGAT